MSCSATYVDGSTQNPHALSVTVTSAASATLTDPATPSSVTVKSLTAVNYLVTGSTAYTPDGQTLTTTDQYGGVTTNTYDAAGNLILTQYPNGTQVRTVYDSLNRVIWQTDQFMPANSDPTSTANVALVTHTMYNALGQAYRTERYENVAIVIEPTGVSGIDQAIAPTGLDSTSSQFISYTQSWYDDQGRTIETRAANGFRTGTIYNAGGQVEYTGPLNTAAPDGGRQTSTDGVATIAFLLSDLLYYTQSQSNLLETTTTYPWSGMTYSQSTDALGNSTRTYTNNAGTISYTVYPDGTYSETISSIGDQPIAGYFIGGTTLPTIPLGGRETISIAEHKLTDNSVLVTISIYDLSGNLLKVYEPQVANGSIPVWQYTYDSSGNETSQTDPNGSVTQYFYDANDNKIRQMMPDGTNTERWTYDVYGNVDTFTDFDGNKTVDTYYNSYDISNNQFAGSLEEVKYYAPPQGDGPYSPASTVQYSYTDLGQVYQVIDSAYGITTYTYDQFGNETSVATTNGVTGVLDDAIHYVYDPVTNLLTETWTGTGDQNSAITDTIYGYTAQGQLGSVTVVKQDGSAPSESFTGNGYNATGGMISETQPTTLYSYNPDGNVTKISYPNGTETDYDYSQMWSATDPQEIVTNMRGSTVLSKFDYDFNDQREKIESDEMVLNVGEATFSNTTITWQYDNDGHLTDETLNDGVAADNYHDHYVYDLAGNRIEEDIDAGDTGIYQTDNQYTYNIDGQLTTETDGNTYNSSSPSPATTIISQYDANGSLIETDSTNNLTNVTTTMTYGYNERGQMVSMTNGGETTTYGYNTAGDKISETTSASATTYLVDDNNPTGYSQVLETWDGGSAPTVTYEIGATIISQTTPGTGAGSGTQYIMPDGQGSTRQLTAYSTINATNGQVVARYDYAGFGNSITLSGVTANIVSTVILYNGQMWDPTSLTYHLRDREYDPALGRYDSFDQTNISAGDVVDSNLYLYTGSDPVNLDDPTGDMSEGEALVVAGISALLTLTIHSIYTHTTQSGSALAGGQYARSSQQLALAVVDLLSLGFGGGVGGAGPELQAVGSAIQVSQFSINAASQFAWQSLAVFAAGLSSFGGQSYVNRPGANVQDVKSANGSTVRIVGQSGSSSTTDGHEEAIDQLAQQQSQQPGTILIFLQRSLRTATGRAFGNSLIPDAIVVRLTDPNDITQGIKIDLYEVTSKSQTEQYLQEKLANIQKLIPQSMQGNTRVLPPSQ